jgi:hypothetical protein
LINAKSKARVELPHLPQLFGVCTLLARVIHIVRQPAKHREFWRGKHHEILRKHFHSYPVFGYTRYNRLKHCLCNVPTNGRFEDIHIRLIGGSFRFWVAQQASCSGISVPAWTVTSLL